MPKSRLIQFLVPVVFAAWLAPSLALAQAATPAPEQFGEWVLAQYTEGRNRTCYMGATPQDSTPKNISRGNVYVNVTHKPGVRDEVSINFGYTFDANAEVTVTIENQNFKMFTNGSGAWNKAPDDDAKMVKAMAAGTRMTVKGKSNRGTETTDTYSLSGFTAAHTAMDKACPAR